MIILKTKRWLDKHEFREVLKIADYKGYEHGEGSVFIFNMDKALKNGYMYEDILLLINEYDLDIDETGLEEIRKLYEEMGIVFEWEKGSGYVKISIPRPIYYSVREIVRQYGSRYLYSDDRYIVYRVKPIYLNTLYKKIVEKNYSIIDRDGLFKEKKLPYKPSLRNIELREYQREALEKWRNNNYRGIIALPTGSGKTVIGIASLVETGVRTLIITFTREQMFQWRDSIIRYTDIEPSMVGLIYSEEKRLAPITITTYQSGFRIINDISPYFKQLIVDEVHHLPADKFKYIALHSIADYRMGLSATPVREDGKHEELFPLLGGIIYYRSPAELANMGYLARYRVYTVKIRLTPEEWKEYERLRKQYRALIGTASFQEVLEAARRGDKKAIEALRIHSKIRMLLAKSKAKVEKAVEIAGKELSRGGKIIIFTQYVEQAEEISRKLNAYLLTGEVPVNERKTILRRFREASRGVLVVTTVGDEGLDIPDANIGIIVSGTGSRRQFIQRLGRLLRPKESNNIAKLYEIILEKTPEEYQSRKRRKTRLEDFTGT